MPIAGSVSDGLIEDESWTNSFNTLSVIGLVLRDSISGIEFYEYAIGTGQGDNDIVDWTSVGVDTFFYQR